MPSTARKPTSRRPARKSPWKPGTETLLSRQGALVTEDYGPALLDRERGAICLVGNDGRVRPAGCGGGRSRHSVFQRDGIVRPLGRPDDGSDRWLPLIPRRDSRAGQVEVAGLRVVVDRYYPRSGHPHVACIGGRANAQDHHGSAAMIFHGVGDGDPMARLIWSALLSACSALAERAGAG